MHSAGRFALTRVVTPSPTRNGRILIETHTIASLHNIFVALFFDRQKKDFVGNRDSHRFNRLFSSGVAPNAIHYCTAGGGSLTGRYVGLHAAGTPFLHANYSGVSGAFAPVWILSERRLFMKYGFER